MKFIEFLLVIIVLIYNKLYYSDILLMQKRKMLFVASRPFMGLPWMVNHWSMFCLASFLFENMYLVFLVCFHSVIDKMYVHYIFQGVFWDNQVLSCMVKKCGMSYRHSCSLLCGSYLFFSLSSSVIICIWYYLIMDCLLLFPGMQQSWLPLFAWGWLPRG